MKHALARFVFKDFTFTYYLPLSVLENAEFIENFSQYILGLREPQSLTLTLKENETYTTYNTYYANHVITKTSSKNPNPLSLKLCERVDSLDFPFSSILSLFAGGISLTHSTETILRYGEYLDEFMESKSITHSYCDKHKKPKPIRPYFKTKPNEKFKRKLESLYKLAA